MAQPLTRTAAVADALLRHGPWFENYTDSVLVFDTRVELPSLNAEARYQENEDAEYVLYGAGLEVSGSIDMAEDVHSIYVAKGLVSARQLILGDAVFVVEGRLVVSDWLFVPATQGVFEINGLQVEGGDTLNLAEAVECPAMVFFSREDGRYAFFARKGDNVVRKSETDLHPELHAALPELSDNAIRAHLEAGRSLFR